jgi:hypothetical protein
MMSTMSSGHAASLSQKGHVAVGVPVSTNQSMRGFNGGAM